MKVTPARVLWVAVAAGALGLLASHEYEGGPLLRTTSGQPAVQASAHVASPQPSAGVTPARPGDPMPAIRLPDPSGKPVDLAAYQGHPLLINVWASWCGPCLQEMPELDRFAHAQQTHGVQVIGLALDTPEAVNDFLTRLPVSYPIVLDTPGPADASVWLGNEKGVLPYTVLINAQGRIARQKIGPFASGEIEHWAAPATAGH